MSFVSISFIFFVLITVILFYILPKKCQWVLLLVASYIFYMFAGIKLLGFLLFTTVSTYLAGYAMGKLDKEYKDKCYQHSAEYKKNIASKFKSKKKRILTLAILLNFTILFFLKYYNFTIFGLDSIFSKIGFNIKLNELSVILPLGISFYMFQSIGYMIDVYRGKYLPDNNFFKFSLFVSFFPQIVQGPISRYDNLSEQLYSKHEIDFDNIRHGIELFMWGYFKKLVIADRAVVAVNFVFDNYFNLSGAFTLVGVLLYCIQLYCDFSGGIDIARGVARLFGIQLVENFKRPYYATSLGDFWRRWHITLGTWMKDYLFYPISLSKLFGKLGKFSRNKIGGTLGKILPTSIASFIVFFAIGMWHGGSDKYIFFGLWNGIIIMLSILLGPFYKKMAEVLHINLNSFGWYIVRIVRTTVIVCIGRYFTRATGLIAAFSMLKNTVTNFNISSLFKLESWAIVGLSAYDYIVILVAFLIVLVVGAFEEKGIEIQKWLKNRSAFTQGIVVAASILIIIIFGIYRGDTISSEFIYKQF